MSENRCSTPRIVLLALLGGMVFLSETSKANAAEAAATPAQIFDRRILPIFKSPNPSSCTQCHLAAVDLKNYILPSHEKTFLSLRDQGLSDETTGGVGLGLALARRWTHLLGGRLTLQSGFEGCGACFRVEVPLAGRAASRQLG